MKMESAKAAFVTFASVDVITTSTGGSKNGYYSTQKELDELEHNVVIYNDKSYSSIFNSDSLTGSDYWIFSGVSKRESALEGGSDEALFALTGSNILPEDKIFVDNTGTLQQAFEWLLTNGYGTATDFQ